MTNSKEKYLTNLLPISGQGGSIVFSLSDLSDFPRIYSVFARCAADTGRQIVRLRFVPDTDQDMEEAIKRKEASTDDACREILVRLNHRFRHFTVNVHEEIMDLPKGTILIFDCLSDLQTAWATDLMMVNFFTVTTPLISEHGYTAVFPLKALMHSNEAARKIMQISDCFIEVCSDFKNLYLRAEKLPPKSGQEMYNPHILDPESGIADQITNGVKLSHFHRAQDMARRIHADLNMDSWDRFFMNAQRKYEYGEDLSEECRRMCQIMMSRDLRMRKLIHENFLPADYFFVKEHMVGSGQIGGKSCGMLTARKLIENLRPDLYDYMEAHDSFYIGSDVYSSYIVENGLWDLSVRQHTEDGYFALSKKLREAILNGSFWPQIEQQFVHLLEYYGQEPIIVRSSSILEDGFDNAFAGKYDSVFVPNIGTAQERLEAFKDAVRTVYASTMSLSALDYRKRRGLSARDEEMAILVMRVSGSHFGDYFMPCAAGVGYSFSPYRFLPALNPEAGMLRLVMGLGTSAVDRIEGAYPRLVSLDQPEASPYHSSAEKHRYSQQKISLIDKTTTSFRYLSLNEIYDSIPPWLRRILLEHDTQAERVFRDRGIHRNIEFVSCRGLTKNQELMELLKEMLRQLHESYGQSVDIEFTINLSEDGDYVVNLLQCRPLLVMSESSGGQSIAEEFIETDSPDTAKKGIDTSLQNTGRQAIDAGLQNTGRQAIDTSHQNTGRQAIDAGLQNTGRQAIDTGLQNTGRQAIDTGLQNTGRQAIDAGCQRSVSAAASAPRILLETVNSSMGMSRSAKVDGIVYIDPVAYYEMPYADKPQIARSLGKLNWHFREEGKSLILLTPGRIGTSSPELGVPTAFSDISSFMTICEIAESKAGYQPELSYGSHIFQDLVEAEILYSAVFEDKRRVHFHPELLREIPNTIKTYAPDANDQVIAYYDLTNRNARIIHDMKAERLQIALL